MTAGRHAAVVPTRGPESGPGLLEGEGRARVRMGTVATFPGCAGTLVAMAGRDDDLDWLYGRGPDGAPDSRPFGEDRGSPTTSLRRRAASAGPHRPPRAGTAPGGARRPAAPRTPGAPGPTALRDASTARTDQPSAGAT